MTRPPEMDHLPTNDALQMKFVSGRPGWRMYRNRHGLRLELENIDHGKINLDGSPARDWIVCVDGVVVYDAGPSFMRAFQYAASYDADTGE